MRKLSKNNNKFQWRVEGQTLIVEDDLPPAVERRITELTQDIFEVENPRYHLRVEGNVISPEEPRVDDDTKR
jgi:ribosome-associated translation inhibitor RaiA